MLHYKLIWIIVIVIACLLSSSKVKRCKAPVLYYANSVKSFNVILSGDIEKNPGPGSHPVNCDTCEKTIRRNSKKTYGTVSCNVARLKYITSNKKISSNLLNPRLCVFGLYSEHFNLQQNKRFWCSRLIIDKWSSGVSRPTYKYA